VRRGLPDGEQLQALGRRRSRLRCHLGAYGTYGGNNRTQMLRIPEGGRCVEHRGCDGSANPYLALAVMLAAGMDGIDRDLDPGSPTATTCSP